MTKDSRMSHRACHDELEDSQTLRRKFLHSLCHGCRQDSPATATILSEMAISLRERNRLAAMDAVRRSAVAMMEEHGFDAVTVEQIAGQSNVSPSTVYRYFGTKEALVLSTERPAQFVERLILDASSGTWVETAAGAADKVWGRDDSVGAELSLALANEALLRAWEGQLLDQRDAIGDALAAARGKKSGAKDAARAACIVAVLRTALLRWHSDGGRKPLTQVLDKTFNAIRTD